MAIDMSVTEEDMEESNSAPTLREGYIGPVELTNLERDGLGDDETPVLRFTFEARDEEHVGQEFEHLEWPITQDDMETIDANGNSNAEIALRRMVHMLSRLLAVDKDTIREDVVRLQGDSLEEAWENLRTNVAKAYQKFGTTDETVHAKAYARERGGYVNVNFPKYPGFIRVVGEDPKLEFTSWEREQNREAAQFLAEGADGDDEFVSDDDEFDFGDDDVDF